MSHGQAQFDPSVKEQSKPKKLLS